MNKEVMNRALRYIDSWLHFRSGRVDIPGFVVAIASKGKVVYQGAFGYADVEHDVKMTTGHAFRIASHSKTFTATALMQLGEQGRLRLDDHVIDYLPWLKEHHDERWRQVTLRQIMSHGAGIIRDGRKADYWQLGQPFLSADQLRKEIMATDLVIEPNTKLKYSNFGYSLLGQVIEAVSGLSYRDYMTQQIIEPLELEHTRTDIGLEQDENIVTGYTRADVDRKRLPIAQVDTGAMLAATGFVSTASDLCCYFSAHFVGSGELLNDESKKEMQKVAWHAYTPGWGDNRDYGLGLELEKIGKRSAFGHGGGFPGQITQSLARPDDQLVVVVLTNCVDGPADMIAHGIYRIIDHFSDSAPSAKTLQNLARFEGRYMSLWSMYDVIAAGDHLEACYPDTWQPFYSTEKLELVDDTTFKVTNAGSFDSDQETVQFHMQDGCVKTVNYTGTTVWPEKTWLEMQTKRSRIELGHS